MRRFAWANFQPLDGQLSSEPRHLALRELSRAYLDQLDGFLERTFTPEMFHDLSVADRLHCGGIFLQPAREQ